MFKFTIRELLLWTLIFGLGLGWFSDRRAMNDLLHRKSQLAESADMKTYALERILNREGYTVLWATDGPRVVVKTPFGATYDYPTDEHRSAEEL